jgi:hypothetical protein
VLADHHRLSSSWELVAPVHTAALQRLEQEQLRRAVLEDMKLWMMKRS